MIKEFAHRLDSNSSELGISEEHLSGEIGTEGLRKVGVRELFQKEGVLNDEIGGHSYGNHSEKIHVPVFGIQSSILELIPNHLECSLCLFKINKPIETVE